MKTRGSAGRTEGPHRAGRRAPQDEVFTITTAADSLREDQSRRAKKYLVQMGIRLLCFVGAAFTHGALMWALIAAAVVLPYMAVLNANAGREKRDLGGPLMEYRELPGAPSAPPSVPPPAPAPAPEPHTTEERHP